jgi:hypothetical protein
VDDAALVRRLHGTRDLLPEGESALERERAALQQLREGLPLDEFEHQVRAALDLFESIDAGDVRMVQRREKFGFPFETSEALVVLGEGGG